VCRDAESPCMGQENYDICISLLERGCPENKIVYMEMCPVSVSCMVDLAEEKDAPGMGLEEKVAPEEQKAPVKGEIADDKNLPAEKDVPEKEGVVSKVCRDAESPCMGQENYDKCTFLLEKGCPENKIVYMEMCPVSVSCMVDLNKEKDSPVMENLPGKEGALKEEIGPSLMMEHPVADSCTKEKLLDDAGYNNCYDMCKGKECCFTGEQVCDDLSVGDCSGFQSCSLLDLDKEDTDVEKIEVETEEMIQEDAAESQDTIDPNSFVEEPPVVKEGFVKDPPVVKEDFVEEPPAVEEDFVEEPPFVEEDFVEEPPAVEEDFVPSTVQSGSSCNPIVFGKVIFSSLLFYFLS